jgi:hypothetical protein
VVVRIVLGQWELGLYWAVGVRITKEGPCTGLAAGDVNVVGVVAVF